MYWECGIRESRQKRKQVSASQQVNEDANESNQSNEGIPGIHLATHDTHPSTSSSIGDYSRFAIKELRQELKKPNARGYSRKSKAELIQQLNEMSTN